MAVPVVSAQVPFERIVNADKEPGNWLTYSRMLDGERFSPLSEINTLNVSQLKVKWAYQFHDAGIEVSPIVIDGILYVTGPNSAAALDGRTGRALWHWKRSLPTDFQSIGFGHTNRGAAVLDDKLFVATLDGYLVALDLKSGVERWSAKVLDYKLGYSMTMAPLAISIPAHSLRSMRIPENCAGISSLPPTIRTIGTPPTFRFFLTAKFRARNAS
ncbi:MAG: PQQ-binding-like beta-propeller repeat protein [Candidatus Acidiferrum sp.]